MKVLECSPDSKNTFVYIFPSLNLQFQLVVERVESREQSSSRECRQIRNKKPRFKKGKNGFFPQFVLAPFKWLKTGSKTSLRLNKIQIAFCFSQWKDVAMQGCCGGLLSFNSAMHMLIITIRVTNCFPLVNLHHVCTEDDFPSLSPHKVYVAAALLYVYTWVAFFLLHIVKKPK